MQNSPRGSILVVDNAGRRDEACVGDLTAWAARGQGLAGMVVWGLHRDTLDLRRMEFPTWSLGTIPTGPQRLEARAADAMARAQVGSVQATREDWVYADDDGVVFVQGSERKDVESRAREIVATERKQAERAAAGTTISTQLDIAGFVEARRKDATLTFREHLRARRGAIEE